MVRMTRVAAVALCVVTAAVGVGMLMGAGCTARLPVACADSDANAPVPNVAGTFDYGGGGTNGFLTGQITFAQEGSTVTVTNVTYTVTINRRLTGQADLVGNQLDIELFVDVDGDVVPDENPQPFFRADVTFVFSADGSEFCVGYSDTNGDSGEIGTFTGVRVSGP